MLAEVPSRQDKTLEDHAFLCRCSYAPGHLGAGGGGVPAADRCHAGAVRRPVHRAWRRGRGAGGQLAGPPDRHRVPDRGRASAWYNSGAYREIVALRTDNSESDVIMVDGVGSE